VRPYRRMSEVAATANPQPGVYVTAFRNLSTGVSAIVAINTNSTSVYQAFTISGLPGPITYTATPYITDPHNSPAQQPALNVSGNGFTANLTGSSLEFCTFRALSVVLKTDSPFIRRTSLRGLQRHSDLDRRWTSQGPLLSVCDHRALRKCNKHSRRSGLALNPEYCRYVLFTKFITFLALHFRA